MCVCVHSLGSFCEGAKAWNHGWSFHAQYYSCIHTHLCNAVALHEAVDSAVSTALIQQLEQQNKALQSQLEQEKKALQSQLEKEKKALQSQLEQERKALQSQLEQERKAMQSQLEKMHAQQGIGMRIQQLHVL